ncbi:MAG: hypothetical protein ABIO24_08605, partial [Saprospiraceae bacterium]
QLSKDFQAQLILYNAIGTAGPDGDLYAPIHGDRINNLFKTAMVRLKKLGDSLPGAYKVRYLIENSNHWSSLIAQVKQERADLVISEMPAPGEPVPGRLRALMYNMPCPTLFIPQGSSPKALTKILVPVRLRDGIEQKLPIVIHWAVRTGAQVLLSAFELDNYSEKEKIQLAKMVEKMSDALRAAGIQAEGETAHGFHFGTTMVKRAEKTNSDLIAIIVEPENLLSRLFSHMVGPYFLENSTVPVLSVPLKTADAEVGGLDSQSTGLANPASLPAADAMAG